MRSIRVSGSYRLKLWLAALGSLAVGCASPRGDPPGARGSGDSDSWSNVREVAPIVRTTRFLETAVCAAEWIRAQQIVTEHGVTWPVIPDQGTDSSTALYDGSPGVILFFLELHRATGDTQWLNDARRGADHLLATLPKTLTGEQSGLYTGVAGTGFVLDQAFRATLEASYREGALQCVQLLYDAAQVVGGGAEWTDCTDIISGMAGTGLFLLYAAEEMNQSEVLDLARKVGRRLVDLAQVESVGRSWRMDPRFARVMPNFSHGTAGVAYFLASLYEATRDRSFLDAAVDGASYLTSIARTEGDVCLIRHHDGDGANLFYLGWCHGPAGTGRLFFRLWAITSEDSWLTWVRACAGTLPAMGVDQQRSDGFWNNVGQCCGSAGAADFLLSIDAAIPEKSPYASYASSILDDVRVRAATAENGGLKWIQAEHRIRPELLQAQTGFAQGAAGIGLAMLHQHARACGAPWTLRLPDSPFP